MEYGCPLFRPPSEASSLRIHVTVGCSWNRCRFRVSYGTSFRPKWMRGLRGTAPNEARNSNPVAVIRPDPENAIES